MIYPNLIHSSIFRLKLLRIGHVLNVVAEAKLTMYEKLKKAYIIYKFAIFLRYLPSWKSHLTHISQSAQTTRCSHSTAIRRCMASAENSKKAAQLLGWAAWPRSGTSALSIRKRLARRRPSSRSGA